MSLRSKGSIAIGLGLAAILFSQQAKAKMPPRTESTDRADGPTKIDVNAKTSAGGDQESVSFEVTLQDSTSKPSPAPEDTRIVIEIARAKSPDQPLEKLETVVKAGSTSAQVSWKPTLFGVLQAKAGSKDKDLLWGLAAFLVHPKKADQPEKANQATSPQKQEGKSKKKQEKAHVSGRTGGIWRPIFAGRCQPPPASPSRPANPGTPPTPPTPPLPQLIMTVSGRGPEGVAADGNDAAKIDLFYDSDDGSPTPRDIRVWLHWEGGTISEQPLTIRAGTFQVQALWTSPAPVVGTVNIQAFPESLVRADTKAVQVKFVRPPLGLRLKGPTRMSFVEVAEFSVEFIARDGATIVNPSDRDLAFTAEDTSGRLDPRQVHMSAGALQVTTSFVPKTFWGTASILASTDGYRSFEHQVTITYLPCLLLALLGGVLGGFMRYLRSQGVWYLRLLVGVVLGALAVLVFVIGVVQSDLTFFPQVIKNNLLSVPVAAFIAGWAGLELLDSIAPFAKAFTGAK